MKMQPPWLMQLDAALEAIVEPADPMILSELDGYLAGILVCPELITPSEWLPLVWGQDDEAEPVFENEQQLSATVDLVMKLYNRISNSLRDDEEQYVPLFYTHPDTDDAIHAFWLAGFRQAMLLRPESWFEITRSDDEDATTALSILVALDAGGDVDTGLSEEELEELIDEAHAIIPYCVQHLNDWRLCKERQSIPAAKVIEQNDPCPCGSGKEYKRCCGLN